MQTSPILNRRTLLTAAVTSGALAAAPPALAQNGRHVPPMEGLLPTGHRMEDAPRPFDRQAMAAGKLALIPSQNYTAFTDWWTRRMQNARPNIFQRAVGHTDQTFQSVRDALDPRALSDRTIETLSPYFSEIDVASDFVAARQGSADFYGVLDYWLRPEGFWTTQYRTRAGLDLLDGRLRLMLSETYNDRVPLEDFSAMSGGQGGSDAMAHTFANAMNGALNALLPAVTARLNAGA